MAGAYQVKIGAVSYLNTRPLVFRLEQLAPQAQLLFDLPSRLADRLARGELDVALIPSIEYFHDPRYQIVSDACIACRGPVLSVKLFARVPPEQIRTLALDEGSRTSAALVQILLAQRFGIRPHLEPLPLGHSIADSSADAVLLIGDRAIHPPAGRFAAVWDLGEEWCRWSGLPFVFAMWVARGDAELPGLEAALSQARDLGLAPDNLRQIALGEAPLLGLTQRECLGYLRDNLYFYLGPREQQGLALFARQAEQLGLLPQGAELGSGGSRTAG